MKGAVMRGTKDHPPPTSLSPCRARQLRLGSGKIIGRNRRQKKKSGDLHARSQGGEWTIGRVCMQLGHIIHGSHLINLPHSYA